jgi:hypothetical protein
MKKVALIIVSVLFAWNSYSQETTKQNEVGIIFNNLHNFGLTFRTGTEQSLWRFNTLTFSGRDRTTTRDTSESSSNRIFGKVAFGKECRKEIATNLALRYGLDFSFSYRHYTDDNGYSKSENTIYTPGFNLIFGLNYQVGDVIVIGAELMPYFEYGIGEGIYKRDDQPKEKSDIEEMSYGLSNQSLMLSVVYRF